MPRVRWDAKTITAIAGLLAVAYGGVELRMTVSRIEDRLQRVDERVVRIEREVSPPPRVAALELNPYDPGD